MNDSDHSLFEHSFQGCMQSIHVDDQLVDLHAVEQGELGSFANVTIDMCAIIDRAPGSVLVSASSRDKPQLEGVSPGPKSQEVAKNLSLSRRE
ncbi:hypothetical protein DUI87_18599 [Hirundo rustica rustica]|uniref:Laminin G domain-containing protein n=1 Tax=Hirundo rustica rustica TaxID=333673 RepID=A0A3M0JXC4_HIRRU|nr:hypothetical protein DUI87_18599 [Hirundo rustica rustica]